MCLFLNRIHLFDIVHLHQKKKGIVGSFQECAKASRGYLLACFQLLKASCSTLPGNIESIYIRLWVVHFVHGEEFSGLCVKVRQLAYFPIYIVEAVCNQRNCPEVLMAVILLAELSSLVRISLVVVCYFFLKFSFMVACWTPSPSFTKSHISTLSLLLSLYLYFHYNYYAFFLCFFFFVFIIYL